MRKRRRRKWKRGRRTKMGGDNVGPGTREESRDEPLPWEERRGG